MEEERMNSNMKVLTWNEELSPDCGDIIFFSEMISRGDRATA